MRRRKSTSASWPNSAAAKSRATGCGSSFQFAGLGFSAMAQRFAIASRDEAVAYLRHGVLGPRLLECTRLVNSVEGKTIRQILGSPDDLKYRSSMTLFATVSPESEFRAAIDKYYAGEADPKTLELLGR